MFTPTKFSKAKMSKLLLVLLTVLGLFLVACSGTGISSTEESTSSVEQGSLPPIVGYVNMNIRKGSGGSFFPGHDNVLVTDDWDWNNNFAMPENAYFIHGTCVSPGYQGFFANPPGKYVRFCTEDTSLENNLLVALQSADMCSTCQVTLTFKYDTRPKSDPKPLISPYISWTITAITH